MAYSTFSTPADTARPVATFFAGIGKTLSNALEALTRAHLMHTTATRRIAQVERLNAKTDEELAAMGLERVDIVRYVYRDLFWN